MITFQQIGRHGRFANQLFQYAMLFALSKKTGFEFGVPYAANEVEDEFQRFCLPDVFPNLSAIDSSGLAYKERYQEADGEHWTYHHEILSVADGTDFAGYFQTPKYFAEFRQDLLREFAGRKSYYGQAKLYLDDLRRVTQRQVVFLHVRRGDALGNNDLSHVGMEYFSAAAREFNWDKIVFLILTDDRDWCDANLGNSLSHLFFSPFNDKFLDFELMRQADGGIIHNSTFSWWGAWLGDENRKIVAPGNWTRRHKCQDLFPDNWMKIWLRPDV